MASRGLRVLARPARQASRLDPLDARAAAHGCRPGRLCIGKPAGEQQCVGAWAWQARARAAGRRARQAGGVRSATTAAPSGLHVCSRGGDAAPGRLRAEAAQWPQTGAELTVLALGQ